MRAKKDDQAALNKLHMKEPVPGDAWYERGCIPVCVVLAVFTNVVVVCTKHKRFGCDEYTWDIEKAETLSRSKFSTKFEYGSIPGQWADVNPKIHPWAVEAWTEIAARSSINDDDPRWGR
jgi:hypothetical protein